MAIGRYAGIAGIEDFINAGDSPDYYDMYLNAGNIQSDLDNLALASGGEMSIGAMNALSKFYDGVAQSKILEQKAGTKPHPLNTALNIGSQVAGFIPGGGGGSGYTGTHSTADYVATPSGKGLQVFTGDFSQ